MSGIKIYINDDGQEVHKVFGDNAVVEFLVRTAGVMDYDETLVSTEDDRPLALHTFPGVGLLSVKDLTTDTTLKTFSLLNLVCIEPVRYGDPWPPRPGLSHDEQIEALRVCFPDRAVIRQYIDSLSEGGDDRADSLED